MPRNSERSFCCGAGGARMWMEEKIGERINVNRTTEAVETGAKQIATACPFCRVMLSDGLTAKQADGSAAEDIEIIDVAQLLLAGVKRAEAPLAGGVGGSPDGASGAGTTTAVLDRPTQEAADAPSPEDAADTVTATEDVGANATAAQEPDPEVESGVRDDGATAPDEPKADAPADPAAETEPVDAANTDPDSSDVTTEDIGEAESTAPRDDAAVQTQTPDRPAGQDEDKLF